MLPASQAGLLGLGKVLITANASRAISWLGRTVTTQACDPKCPKIDLNKKCCRTRDSDNDCLITDPHNFWFPGNIYYPIILPDKSHLPTLPSTVDLDQDDSDSGSD